MYIYSYFKIAVFLFIGVSIITILIKKTKKEKVVGSYNGVLFSLFAYYSLFPFLIFCLDDKETEKFSVLYDSSFEAYFLFLLSLFLLIIFYNISYKYNNNDLIKRTYELSNSKLFFICRIVSLLTFIVGGITFLIYIRGFGGIGSLLAKGDYLRAFSSNAQQFVSYSVSIMVIPARLITVTPVITAPLFSYKFRNKPIYGMIFIISFILSIIFILANAGKTALLIYIITFALPIISKKYKHPWIIVIIIGLVSLPIISIFDSFFLYLQIGVWIPSTSGFSGILSQFFYPISNVLSMHKAVGQFGLRWGQDYITGLLNIIPGVNFSPSYELMSEFYGGVNWKMVGGTPDDIITFGYIEFRIIGVILNAIILGFFSGKIDNLLRTMGNTYGMQVLKVSIIMNFFSLVVNADVVSIVRTQFTLTITVICLLLARKKTKKNNKTSA